MFHLLVKKLFRLLMKNFSQGVTYCGESKASTLTMENIPWHKEVVEFVKKLVASLPDYEIASEHEHSNCILVANKKVSAPKFNYYISFSAFNFTFHE